jgi:hypothetical protein
LPLKALNLFALPPNFAVLLFKLVPLFGLLDIALLQLIADQRTRPRAQRRADGRACAWGTDRRSNNRAGSPADTAPD